MTELESLRLHLNTKLTKGEASLYLPAVPCAGARADPAGFPQCNVRYDAERNVLLRIGRSPRHRNADLQRLEGASGAQC